MYKLPKSTRIQEPRVKRISNKPINNDDDTQDNQKQDQLYYLNHLLNLLHYFLVLVMSYIYLFCLCYIISC